MKSIIISFKFIGALFLMLPLALCSSEEDNTPDTENLEAVTINFTTDFFTDCNQIKNVDGVQLSYVAITQNENSCSQELGTCNWSDNIYPNGFTTNANYNQPALALFGGVLEIDISALSGASQAIITVDDNCGVGCTQANLYEGNTVVASTANTILGTQIEDLVLNLSTNATKVTVWSCEGAVVEIRIL